MPINIVVCAKQVVDPETPASAFIIDPETKSVVPAAGIPPVVNGFDENAVEAALQLKEADGANITVVSVGNGFVMDVMKKPLSMGADELMTRSLPNSTPSPPRRPWLRPSRRSVTSTWCSADGRLRTGTTPWSPWEWPNCLAFRV